jgi:hypothetical protein
VRAASTFTYKDYRLEGPGRFKTMTLATHEFIWRFLIHVLPKGFHRIRHYGLLANGGRPENIAKARALLAVTPVTLEEPARAGKVDDGPRALAQPMSMLRRAHDRHRGLRSRLLSRHTVRHPCRRSGSIPHDAITASTRSQYQS